MYPFILYTIKLKPEALEELSLTEFKWVWHNISHSQILSEQFIDKYADKLDWYFISANQVLSELFIEKYKDKLNWYFISVHQVLSEPFIEKYVDKVDWCGISSYQNLSLELLIKSQNKINLKMLRRNYKIPQETKDKFLEITNKNI